MASDKSRILIALGGNALARPGQKGTAEEQRESIDVVCQQIVKLIDQNHEIVVTHGNGPQVGAILAQQKSQEKAPPMPLDVCGAESQGEIGYLIQLQMRSAFNKANVDKEIAALITVMEVDPEDPRIKKPTKQIGVYFDEAEAKRQQAKGKQVVKEGSKGWRWVVPSPLPQRALQMKSIKTLVDAGTLVIAGGGGGVPVIIDRKTGYVKGVEGVIDKDHAAKLLALGLNANLLLILMQESNVYLNYEKQDTAEPVKKVTVNQMKEYIKQGCFEEGSMLPKVEAAIEFVEKTGRKAIIASIEQAVQCIDDESVGTHIVPNDRE